MKIIIGALLAALSITSALAETVLITGTNRGIGLEFVKQYAERGATVIATARRPTEAKELTALASRYPNVTIEALDVAVEHPAGESIVEPDVGVVVAHHLVDDVFGRIAVAGSWLERLIDGSYVQRDFGGQDCSRLRQQNFGSG